MPVFPVAILDRKVLKRRNQVVAQVLVQWTNSTPEDATWEDATVVRARFPGVLDMDLRSKNWGYFKQQTTKGIGFIKRTNLGSGGLNGGLDSLDLKIFGPWVTIKITHFTCQL
ncbi:hypothetical protein LWI28_005158 [Acer negundo]|uniref:Chromo domain-containing protein n=1 Tax=Acer negundo TaxID=4023 RepID=A0AAD5NRD5_ACENE|nr:hypothetical protein LWI28_005158 [Acer negundo]